MGRGRHPLARLGRRDRLTVAAFIAIPASIQIALVWLPTAASVGLSLTRWDGLGGVGSAEWVGLDNYEQLLTGTPLFWSALANNVAWLAAFVFVATPLGMLFAVLLDREIRGSAFYRSALYVPVVLSMALVGFIWQLQYAPEQGFINGVLGTTGLGERRLVDWLGDPDINLWAVLVAAGWRHVGYVMLLYLAGLKSVDPNLREAAALDGANERQAFFRVVLPVMQPINVLVVVVTAIEAIRAFDLVYVINRGLNGLELLSVLVTNTLLGEGGRIGFGSAIATVLLLIAVVPISVYLRRALRDTTR